MSTQSFRYQFIFKNPKVYKHELDRKVLEVNVEVIEWISDHPQGENGIRYTYDELESRRIKLVMYSDGSGIGSKNITGDTSLILDWTQNIADQFTPIDEALRDAFRSYRDGFFRKDTYFNITYSSDDYKRMKNSLQCCLERRAEHYKREYIPDNI